MSESTELQISLVLSPVFGAFYTRVRQALTYATKYIHIPVVAHMSYIPELVYEPLCQIISQLSFSRFTSLLTLIERCGPDSKRILSRFRQLRNVESPDSDTVDASETISEKIMDTGAADREYQELLDKAGSGSRSLIFSLATRRLGLHTLTLAISSYLVMQRDRIL